MSDEKSEVIIPPHWTPQQAYQCGKDQIEMTTVATLTRERDGLKSAVVGLQHQVRMADADIADLTAERDSLKGEVERLRAARDAVREQFDRLHSNALSAEARATSLRERLTRVEDLLTGWRRAVHDTGPGMSLVGRERAATLNACIADLRRALAAPPPQGEQTDTDGKEG